MVLRLTWLFCLEMTRCSVFLKNSMPPNQSVITSWLITEGALPGINLLQGACPPPTPEFRPMFRPTVSSTRSSLEQC